MKLIETNLLGCGVITPYGSKGEIRAIYLNDHGMICTIVCVEDTRDLVAYSLTNLKLQEAVLHSNAL